MSSTRFIEGIADFVVRLEGRILPKDVIQAMTRAVLDCLAAALAGVNDHVSQVAVRHAAGHVGRHAAGIIGHAGRAPALGAAFANGTIAHAIDYDDQSMTAWTHPTPAILPAALALAEEHGASGLDLLTALVAGLETQKAIGIAAQPGHFRAGWHSTGTLGVLGAAAAAGKILGLDRAALATALAIAASRTGGLRENFGTMTKPLHVGFAARDGVEAALLARRGVTANPEALEGPNGFLRVYGPQRDGIDRALQALGNPFEAVDPGLVFKLYPCCGDIAACVDGVLLLRQQHALTPESVARIRLGVSQTSRECAPNDDPKTPLEAKFSIPYATAAAFVRGHLGLAEFTPEALEDAKVRRCMERVEVVLHPDLARPEAISYCSPAIVEIETKGGEILRKIVRDMRGHPKNPLTEADLEAKFEACAATVLDRAAIRKVIGLVQHLDDVPNVSVLVRALQP